MNKTKFVFDSFVIAILLFFSVSFLAAEQNNSRAGKRPVGKPIPAKNDASAKANPSKKTTAAKTDAKPAANAAAAAPAANAEKKPINGSDGSEFNIPKNATPEELLQKANDLLNTERNFQTQDEYNAWIKKMVDTVFSILDQVMSADINDDLYRRAVDIKGNLIYFQGTTDPNAYQNYEKFARGLQKDQRLLKIEGGQTVANNHLASLLHWGCTRTVQTDGTVEDLKKNINEFQALVLENPDYVSMVPELIYPVTEMAKSKKDNTIPKKVFMDFATALKKSDDKKLQDAAKGLEGILRFAELKGKPFQVVGTEINGEKFDSASLKGKIYVVNFWATWVTPSIAMYPDLLAVYVQYQDKGLEMISYSIDDDAEKAKDYVDSKKVPWTNLSEALSVKNEQPSLSEFYGITSVPTLILVGKDGKVIDNDLDIQGLNEKLAELLK